jgi:hypothetical protein
MHTAMNSFEGIFSAIRNSITALCLSRTSSQSSISTGTEPELRIAMGSRSRMVEGRYHVTAWNRFYPRKKYDTRKQNFSASPYIFCFSKCLSVLYAYYQVSHISFNCPLCWWTGLCARDVLLSGNASRLSYIPSTWPGFYDNYVKSRSRVALWSESSFKLVWGGYLQHYEVCWCTPSASQSARHSHIWSCRRIDPLLQTPLTRAVEHWPVLNRTPCSAALECFGKLL